MQRVQIKETYGKRQSRRVGLEACFWMVVVTLVMPSPYNLLSRITEAEETQSKDADAGAKQAEGQEESEDDVDIPEEMPEDAIFIPLWFARQLPQTFYKGTDPEWQSFIELSKDKKRSQLVRNELAGLIGRHVAGMKNFEKQLGKPIQPRKYWLDIDFPDGPPPAYERAGLEIADEYIALTTRPVDPVQVSRLEAVLWPKPIAVSVWSSYSTLWSLQVARAKQFLGIQSEDKPMPKSADVVDFQELAKASKKQGNSSGAKAEQDAESIGEVPDVPHPSSSNLSSSDASKVSEAKQRLQSLGLLGMVGDFGSALTSFKNSLLKTWKFPSTPPERGTVIVSGLVELVGSKATCVLDVHAAFHPKENRFVAVGIGVRRLQARKQAPKGGK